MRKITLLVCIIGSLFLFLSASVWEGTAAIGEDLPESGLYIATNSFPINTVVDVVNLENGRSTSLIVSSRLEIAGFLGLLSRDAANIIDIPNRSVARIRMSQSEDPMAFSHFSGIRIAGSPPDTDAVFAPIDEDSTSYDNIRTDGGEIIVDLPEDIGPQPPPGFIIPEFESLTMVPSEPRPPAAVTGPVPDPVYFIPPVILSPGPAAPPPPPQIIQPSPITTHLFPAPLISHLDRGMYYIQIAAYSRPEAVSREITGIDNNLPIKIMNAGSTSEPVYRILIGPLNLGESGAVFERFRHSHRDAFIRYGG